MYRNGLLSLIIALSSTNVIANSQDVIYKKDGSVLKGTLIEQDFENGRYKIQLMGGSVFVVQRDDIEKITKEAAPVSQTEQELDALAVESRAKSSKISQYSPSMSNIDSTYQKPLSTDSVFYIGTLSHIISVEHDNYYYSEKITQIARYGGIKLGFQKNYSNNIAAQLSLNSGKLNSVEIVDQDDYVLEEYSGSDLVDESYLGLSGSIIASTNLQRGWQFYTGLGLLHDEYSNEYGDATFTSLGLELGMGYSWQSLQLALQYQGAIAGDYPSEFSVGHLNLQLGVNFK